MHQAASEILTSCHSCEIWFSILCWHVLSMLSNMVLTGNSMRIAAAQIALKFRLLLQWKWKFHSTLPCEILPIFNATLMVFIPSDLSQISQQAMLLVVLITWTALKVLYNGNMLIFFKRSKKYSWNTYMCIEISLNASRNTCEIWISFPEFCHIRYLHTYMLPSEMYRMINTTVCRSDEGVDMACDLKKSAWISYHNDMKV